MDQENRNLKIEAVKAADAINAIEGAPISNYARTLSNRWVRGEISGEDMKAALLVRYRKLAADREARG